MRTLIGFVVMLLVSLGTATVADQAPTFHGIKLGVSLGSQFQECPWRPPKEGDIPKYISPPDKDDKGNTISCFHDYLFRPAVYPQVTGLVQLYEHFTFLKDTQGNVLKPEPLPSQPTVFMELLVPASTSLHDGTIEEVILEYLPLESDRVKDDLIKKFGASHPPDKKVSPKIMEYVTGSKLISIEAWETGWGELSLVVTDKDVTVIATTSKLTRFKQESKKDEF
jgi:hypothetical protein